MEYVAGAHFETVFLPETEMRSLRKFSRPSNLPSVPVERPHIFDQILLFLRRQPERNDEI